MRIDEVEPTHRLYHGTCEDRAATLLDQGWQPGVGQAGANQGQRRFLYVTTEPENALWFAEQAGCSTVLEIVVPETSLRVDPEDGVGETIEEEFAIAAKNSLPANFVVTKPLPARAFRVHRG